MSSLLAINVQYNQSERQQWSEGINKGSSEILIMSSEEGLKEASRDVRDLNLSNDVNILSILTFCVKLYRCNYSKNICRLAIALNSLSVSQGLLLLQ